MKYIYFVGNRKENARIGMSSRLSIKKTMVLLETPSSRILITLPMDTFNIKNCTVLHNISLKDFEIFAASKFPAVHF